MSESSTTKIKNKIKALDSSLELWVIGSFTTFIMEGEFLYMCGEHKHNIMMECLRRSSWTLGTIALHVHDTQVCDGLRGNVSSGFLVFGRKLVVQRDMTELMEL